MKRNLLCLLLMMALLGTVFTVPSVSASETNTALLSYLAGDINGDWSVTTTDAREMLTAIVTEAALPAAADANGDGVVNTADASCVLKTAVGTVGSALIKPTLTIAQAAPEGEPIAFERANARYVYDDDSRRKTDVWVAQSLEELQASYTHSNGRADYSADFTAEMFENNAVIVLASHDRQNGLVDMQVTRIVRNGNELCLVRTVELFMELPTDWFERYLLVVSKEDLVGIDTISLWTEYTYQE